MAGGALLWRIRHVMAQQPAGGLRYIPLGGKSPVTRHDAPRSQRLFTTSNAPGRGRSRTHGPPPVVARALDRQRRPTRQRTPAEADRRRSPRSSRPAPPHPTANPKPQDHLRRSPRPSRVAAHPRPTANPSPKTTSVVARALPGSSAAAPDCETQPKPAEPRLGRETGRSSLITMMGDQPTTASGRSRCR